MGEVRVPRMRCVDSTLQPATVNVSTCERLTVVAVTEPRNCCVLNAAVAAPPSQGKSSLPGPRDTFSFSVHDDRDGRMVPTLSVAPQCWTATSVCEEVGGGTGTVALGFAVATLVAGRMETAGGGFLGGTADALADGVVSAKSGVPAETDGGTLAEGAAGSDFLLSTTTPTTPATATPANKKMPMMTRPALLFEPVALCDGSGVGGAGT